MKTKHLVCVLAVFALLICAGTARADMLFSYDFENLNTGNIIGQDNWVVTGFNPTNWLEPYVGTGTGANTSKVFLGNPAGGTTPKTSGAKRYYDAPLTFSSDDTAIELKFWGYTKKGTADYQQGDLVVGMAWAGIAENYMNVGIYYKYASSQSPNTYYRNGKGTIFTTGDTLVAGHWYEIKTVMDFSHVCAGTPTTYGKLTYYYRDITENEAEFTMDGALQNMDMYLPLNGSGLCQSNGIFAYVKSYDTTYQQTQYIDNISVFDPIPEPSTLALLAAGLIGLLAYAWRKRK